MQKREIIFVYLPNTSYFMHFQSVRQKKWNFHYKTDKYRWHFRSKPHQTTSLKITNEDSVLQNMQYGEYGLYIKCDSKWRIPAAYSILICQMYTSMYTL